VGPPQPRPLCWRVVAAAVGVLLAAGLGPVPGRAAVEGPARPTGPSTEAACAEGSVPSAPFRDVPPASAHAASIDCLVWWGITAGTAARAYQPEREITRAQMATMLARLLDQTDDLPLVPEPAPFVDIAGSVHRASIDALAELGVVTGVGDRFEPEAPVDRGQTAAMLVRVVEEVYGQALAAGPAFADTVGNVHAADIAKLAGAGVTTGSRVAVYRPERTVTRGQMASFLVRVADLLVEVQRATAPPPAAPTGSEGCGVLPPAADARRVAVGDEQRSYRLDLPPGYDPDVAYPVVFAFHGAGSSGAAFRRADYGNLSSAMGDHAVLVHPDATGAGRAWDSIRDAPFFDALLSELWSDLCIDRGRLFAVGHGNGAIFANHLGCVRGDVLRGIAPVAGMGPGGTAPSCTGDVAVWAAHADPETLLALDFGTGTRDRWLAENRCGRRAEPFGSGVAYRDCESGEPVVWVDHDEADVFPVFAAAEVWRFFTGL
jgi:polyhydroxybutyrate depolymerase